MAELPSSVGLPQEMMLGHLDFSLPPDAKSYSVKIQPSNLSSVTSTFSLPTTIAGIMNDQPATVQNIIFDIPCGTSPSLFLDNRFTTVNFTATVTCTNVGVAGAGGLSAGNLRGSAYSYFDRMYITSQNGQIIEDIGEFGLTNDTLLSLQLNNAVRHGTSQQYGFSTSQNQNNSSDSEEVIGCVGREWNTLTTGATLATSNSETHSYSIPLTSGVLGVLADKFLNIGRTSKLQVVLQTSSIVPISAIVAGSGAWTTAPTFNLTLSNFSLQCEYIDVGINALQMLDQTLVDGKSYIHGTTWRTSTASLPASAGSMSLLAGIRASSVKSLFVRFAQNGAATTTNTFHGKYDSFMPLLNRPLMLEGLSIPRPLSTPS